MEAITNHPKRILLFFIIFIFVQSLCGCSTEAQTLVDPTTIGLNIYVKEVSSTGLTMIVENESDSTFIYGAKYQLEVCSTKDNWSPVSPRSGATWQQEDWIGTIPPESSETIIYNWDWYYGEIPSGCYRILVDFSRKDNQTISRICVEFSPP